MHPISIHALRVEGDPSDASNVLTMSRFLSTPSGWRATLFNSFDIFLL